MQHQKFLQFLIGLNETYKPARAQILIMTHVPSVNKAYSMLVERENQMAIVSTVPTTEMTGMTALMTDASIFSSKPKKNWNLICDFCKKKGHTKAECYKIMGYAANFSFRFKRKFDSAIAHNVVVPGNWMMEMGDIAHGQGPHKGEGQTHSDASPNSISV
ncbi:hypothetical protein KY289_030810 [Solanum tuberosum]|nr:hypothetical protein KY289_030810 [Solanum tuberosum]